MNFEALDGTKLIILMIAGAAFAGVGLYLLLRPRPQGAAKIEIFGLKFESSSAGLLVFLIGAIFLVLPVFVPERATNDAAKSATSTADEDDSPSDTGAAADNTTTASRALVLPDEPNVREQEPNNKLRDSNQLEIGSIVAGNVVRGNSDWFVFPLDSNTTPFVQVKLKRVGGGAVAAKLFDQAERELGQVILTRDGAEYKRFTLSNSDRAYVHVYSYTGGDVSYELTLLLADPP